jgi:hypothetical protein
MVHDLTISSPDGTHLQNSREVNIHHTKSNSNSLANQLGIHITLAKQEKLASNSLANQLDKNRNLAKLTSARAYMRARIVVAIIVSL